jgi:hypothetical protein
MSNEFKGLKFSSMAAPWVPVGHPRYKWYGSADVDVTRTWRAYGWKPLDEQRADTHAKERTPFKVLRQM